MSEPENTLTVLKSLAPFFTVEMENILLKTKVPILLSFTRTLNPPGFITTELASLKTHCFCSENSLSSEC